VANSECRCVFENLRGQARGKMRRYTETEAKASWNQYQRNESRQAIMIQDEASIYDAAIDVQTQA